MNTAGIEPLLSIVLDTYEYWYRVRKELFLFVYYFEKGYNTVVVVCRTI